jgi:hypothetical protein
VHLLSTSAADQSGIAARSYPFFTPIADRQKIRSIWRIAMEPTPIPGLPVHSADRRQTLMAKAEELETTFLAEMLAHSGLGEMEGGFGGGPGEAQFASFLRQEQARLMVEGGGIGLAEMIFNTMVEAEHADHA